MNYNIHQKFKKILKSLKHITPQILVFLLVLAWIFSGWPVLWQNPRIPPEVKEAKALDVSQGDGLVIYGVSANTTPQWRTYDGSTNSFSAAQNSVTGSTGLQFVIKTSPTKQEAIAGYINSSGVLQIMCYNGTSWSNEWTATVGGTGTDRRFNIAYETNSGDVMVLYSGNVGTTNELRYRTKSGTNGCGASNWSTEQNLDPLRTSGVVQWVKIASDRRSSSNLIAAIWADANSDLSAMIWSGTAWSNEPSAALETSLEVVAAAQDVDDFDVEYESLSGDVMVVWANSAGNNGTNGVRYATCTGGTATCTWSGVLTPPSWLDDATHLDISANPNTDEILFASIGNAGSDLQYGYWSGSAWTNVANADTACENPPARAEYVATGWLISGNSTRGIVVYYDSNSTAINYRLLTPPNSWTGTINFTPTPTLTDGTSVARWHQIIMDPFNKDRLILLIGDSPTDLFAKQAVWNGTTLTWTNADGGSALTTSLSQLPIQAASFDYWRFIPSPTFNQSAYRLFNNLDSTDLSAIISDPTNSDDQPHAIAFDSNSIYVAGHCTGCGSNGGPAWRIEKRSISTGALDSNFGTGGVVISDPTTGDDGANAIAIDSNSIYVAGWCFGCGPNGSYAWMIEKRSISTGALDSNFGTGGVIISDPTNSDDAANAITIDSNSIYVAGYCNGCGSNGGPAWRIEKRSISTGALDSNFGTGGVVISDPTTGADESLAIVLDSNSIYVAGYCIGCGPNGFRAWRIEKRSTSTGALDSNFGTGGAVISDPASEDDQPRAIVLDSNSIYVAGWCQNCGSNGSYAWMIEKRSTSTGALDSNFGTGGAVISDPTTGDDGANAIAIDSNSIYVAGWCFGCGPNGDYAWRIEKRSTSTGALDSNFGTGGVVISDPTTGNDQSLAIIFNSNSIYVAGYCFGCGSNGFAAWRIDKRSNSDGLSTWALPLANQDTSTTLSSTGQAFRLRLLLHVGVNLLARSGQNFKLQFAQQGVDGLCDTSFSGETYADITTSTVIAYNDNPTPADGATSTANSNDPVHNTDIIRNQTYEELNPFTNSVSAINSGEDGKWDFSLKDNGATASTPYCFRVVKSDGTLLDTYTVIPQITTAAASGITCSLSATSTSFSALSPSAVSTSSPDITITISSGSGFQINVKDAGNGTNPGLYKSTSPTYLIQSQDATLSAGTDGYGIQAATTTAGSGGIITLNSKYNKTGNNVGGLSLTDVQLASSTTSVTNREIIIKHKAAISFQAPTGNYSDTITYTCAAQ